MSGACQPPVMQRAATVLVLLGGLAVDYLWTAVLRCYYRARHGSRVER